MKRIFASALVLVALLVSCSRSPNAAYRTVGDVAWSDYAPFTRNVTNTAVLSTYPFLRGAPIYHLTLALADDLTSLTGRAQVRYTAAGDRSQSTLDFVLLPNIAAGSMKIGRVKVDGRDAVSEVSVDGMVLHVTFLPALEPGQHVVITMDYTLSVPRSSEVGFGGLESADGIVSLGYAYPMIPATGRWKYGKPPAYGDLTANPVSFYLAEISYPSDLVLAASGVVLDHVEEGERARDLVALGPARDFYLQLGKGLELRRKQAGGVELRTVTPAVENAEAVLDVAARALALYQELFGPYPYRSLTFVSTRFEAYGLEFPGIIVLTSWLYGDPTRVVGGTSVQTLLEATVAHEVAHQWFYGLIGNDQLSEPWIDESFAQYATLRYYVDRYGESGASGFRRSLDGRQSRVNNARMPIGGAVSSYSPRQYGAVIYGRGPLFIEALSRDMGAARFDRFLRALASSYRWKTISGGEIKDAAERSCSCSLDALWDEWVTPRGASVDGRESAPAGKPAEPVR